MTTLGHNFVLGIKGTKLTADEELWLKDWGVFSIVLYKRNIENQGQLRKLQDEILNLSYCYHNQGVFFSIDMEGGPIHELPSPPFAYFPSGQELITQGANQETIYQYALHLGTYLKTLGFDMNYSPVADILHNPNNDLIRKRAWGITAEEVLSRLEPYVQGFADAGIFLVSKHFPGHGNTSVDTHKGLAQDLRSQTDIESQDLKVFKQLEQWGIPFIMTAHVIYPALDDKLPATLSYKCLTQWARKIHQIKAYFIADDLDMGALEPFGDPQKRLLDAAIAGCDFFMFCHRDKPPFQEIEYLAKHLPSQECSRLQESAQKFLWIKKQTKPGI